MEDDKRKDDLRPPTPRVPQIEETLAPQRNFFISTADRVRAAAGPHAYMRRRRHIEDLTATLQKTVAAAIARAGG